MSAIFESSYRPTPLEDWARSNTVCTLPALFRNAITKHQVGPHRYLGSKVNGVYRYHTYSEIQQKIHQVATALIELGIQPEERVALWSQNCPEWPQVDFGVAHAAAVCVPLYPTLSGEAIEALMLDSGARVLVCNTPQHLKAILSIQDSLPSLQHIVSIQVSDFAGFVSTKTLWTWTEFLALGSAKLEGHKDEMERRIASLKATDVTSIVYTSGTTGEPKGAMLMHGNFVSNAFDANANTGFNKSDVELSFLPLCHVFERIAMYTMTSVGATIVYAESVEQVGANLLEVRPSSMPSVPRLYEKMHGRIMEGVSKAPMVKRQLFAWAFKTGKAYQAAKTRGKVPGWLQLEYEMAHKLVFKKIHERFGGNIRFFISGGAPLRKDLAEFFSFAGLMVLEGYGLTETSPCVTSNPPGGVRPGTVGKPIRNTEVRIAPDGEIIVRGPQVMLGYYNKGEATAEAIDSEGYFHTGDIGEFTDEGYLKITDRKKDLLVMSNGKNVAPQALEHRLNASPLIEQAVVLGDNRKFISALVYPAYPQLKAWLTQQGISDGPESLPHNQKLLEHLQKEVDRCCVGLSNYEVVKKIAILPHELTMDGGELTPTLKVKRKVVSAKYAAQIAEIYASEGPDKA